MLPAPSRRSLRLPKWPLRLSPSQSRLLRRLRLHPLWLLIQFLRPRPRLPRPWLRIRSHHLLLRLFLPRLLLQRQSRRPPLRLLLLRHNRRSRCRCPRRLHPPRPPL